MVRVGALGQLELNVIFRGKKIFFISLIFFLIFLTFLIFLRLTTLVLGIISMDVITFPFPWIRRVTFSALKVMSALTVITSVILSRIFSSILPMIGFKNGASTSSNFQIGSVVFSRTLMIGLRNEASF